MKALEKIEAVKVIAEEAVGALVTLAEAVQGASRALRGAVAALRNLDRERDAPGTACGETPQPPSSCKTEN